MKNIFIILILFIVLIVTFFILTDSKQDNSLAINEPPNQEKIRIGVCPTFFEITKKIDPHKYEIIKTTSTAESLALLRDQKVDMILAGRTLKPDEPQMDSLLIKEGYSFLSDQEITIYIDQLRDQTVYTDLDIGIVKKALSLEKLEKVNNVYDYLNKGIVVTSWENTDYLRAKIIHVLETNGERFKPSRQATIYCSPVCGKEAQEIALLIEY